MKKLSNNPNKFWVKKKFVNLIYILLLLSLTFYAWRSLPDLPIRSDGFIYLLNDMQKFWKGSWAITGFETGAVLFGGIFAKLFGPNMEFYLWAEIVWILVIAVVFFIFLKVVTKKIIVAFSGALIASSSYFGSWDMLSVHCYCFFLERITVVPLLIASLIFLHLFLEKSKNKYYFVSIFFYFLGVGLAHFSVLFTAPFLFYPFFFKLFNHEKKKDIVWGLATGLSYLLLSCFFVLIQQINESGLRPTWGFFEFMLNPQKFPYIENMINQLVYWLQYPPILQHLGDTYPFHHLTEKNASSISFGVIIIYFISAIFIYFKLPKQRAILLTSIFGVLTILYLNSYFHLYDVAQPDSNRYMYFVTFLYAIFWSHLLWAVFFKRKSVQLFTIGILIVVGYYIVNYWLITSKIRVVVDDWERSTLAIFNKFYQINDSLKKGTLVLGPYPEIGPQEADFFTEKLGKGRVLYTTEYRENWREMASSSAHVLLLRYDKSCNCVKEEEIK